jgi:hypothetical protein
VTIPFSRQQPCPQTGQPAAAADVIPGRLLDRDDIGRGEIRYMPGQPDRPERSVVLAYPTAQCPTCHRGITVDLDGVFRLHAQRENH